MIVPFWKKLLSYVVEVPLERKESAVNGEIAVNLYKGRFLLASSDAIYSFDDKYTNFKVAILSIDWEHFQLNDALHLGFGLGSVQLIMEQAGKIPDTTIAIDADKDVIKFAERYSLPRFDGNVELIHADAGEFIRDCHQKFSFIAIDIFINDVIPIEFRRAQFLKDVKALLEEKGILMFNFLAQNKRDIATAKSYYHKVFVDIFSDGEILVAGKNYILVNDKEQFKEDVHWLR